MKNLICKLIMIIPLLSMASCASAGQTYNWLDAVQASRPVVPKPEAYLKVYSEARIYRDGDIPRIDRVPYTIYSADGKKIKWVAFNDQDPKLITLPPGKYVIVPDTNMTRAKPYGAILQQGQLTEVHMQGENPTYAPYQF